MKELDVSQAELADRSDMSPSQVSKIYNGSSFPSVDACVSLARGLSLPVEVVLLAAAGQTKLPDDERRAHIKNQIDKLPDEYYDQVEAVLGALVKLSEKNQGKRPGEIAHKTS